MTRSLPLMLPRRFARTPGMDDLAQRIDRLESREAIRQLVSHYGVLIDSRDLDGLTDLFVGDARVTRTERGRPAMRALLEKLCRQFTTSIHFVGAGSRGIGRDPLGIAGQRRGIDLRSGAVRL